MTDRDASAAELAALAQAQGCDALDLRFTDVTGRWLGVSLRATQLRAADGPVRVAAGNLPGWRRTGIGDLALAPVAGTALRDHLAPVPTLAAIAEIHVPGEPSVSALDPRATLARALAALARRGVADEMRVGAELEFHLFEQVSYRLAPTECGFSVTAWDAGAAGLHAGHAILDPAHHLAPSPIDAAASWRAALAAAAEQAGLEPLRHQHEAGHAQHELVLRHVPALAAADRIQRAKSLVLAMAARAGKTATFMPLPLAAGPGSGLHLNVSFWRDGAPLLAAAGGEELARGFVGGVFAHAKALNALVNPSTNGFRRLARLYPPDARLVWGSPIAAPRSGCRRPRRRARRGWNCAFPMRPPIRISPWPRWRWRGWTGSRAASTRVRSSDRIRAGAPGGTCVGGPAPASRSISPRRSRRWMPIGASCWRRARSSPRCARRWPPSWATACAAKRRCRIPTNTRPISGSDPD